MSNADADKCPKCEKTNPVGAKFCSGCATSLGAGAQSNHSSAPPPPPPPPFSRGGAMMGSFGGKSTSRQFDGEASALYLAAVGFVESQTDSEITYQAAPQQICTNLIFKDFLTTVNAPIKVSSEIQITATAPGQSSVAINSKVDWSSTTSIWLFTVAMVVIMMILNPFLIFMWLLIGGLGSVLNAWMLSTRAPNKVADDLFDYLRTHAKQSSASNQGSQQSEPDSKPDPVVKPAPVAKEEEAMERIKKLAELKELGAITAEEFEAKKAELLKRI